MFANQTIIIFAVFCAVVLICLGIGIFLAFRSNDHHIAYIVIVPAILAALLAILLRDDVEKRYSAGEYDLSRMAEDYGAAVDYGDYDEPRLEHYLLTDEWIYRIPQFEDPGEQYRLN